MEIEKYKKLHQWKPLPEEIAKLNEMLKRMDNIEESIRQEENRLGAMDFRGLVAKGAIASIERTISFLKQELKRLEEDIDKLLDENPEFREQAKRLRTVPGIGKKNCLPFLVLMHRWKNMTEDLLSKKLLVAYVGLDPMPFESGKNCPQTFSHLS